MIHVVIVEDEMLVRLGTKLCLEDSEGSIRVEEAFESGEEALEYFRENTADVLITDIMLTGISGLELIREIKQDHMHMRTIVLSCYEDFAYAREAMELGVDKYLLKHELTGDDLSRAVTEVYEENRAVQGKIKQSRERNDGEKHDADVYQGYVLGYLVLRGETDPQNSGPGQLDFNILAEIIQKLLNIGRLGECFLRRDEEIFLVFHVDKGITEKEFSEKVRNFYERLTRNIFNFFNKNTYLFLSGMFKSLGEVAHVFQKTKSLSAYAFYFEKSGIFFTENLRPGCDTCPRLKMITESTFTEKWFADSEKQIQNFFFSAGKNLVDVAQVKAEVVKYFYALEECLCSYCGTEKGEFSCGGYTSIDAFDSALRLQEWLLGLLDEVKEKLPVSGEQARRIEEYIRQHYQEELSLDKVSAVFHMSMPYFCQYFKKSMGVNFVTYLNRFRIQKAKELLRNPGLSTEQVAASIGIDNPNYFVRLFKKMTGQTVGTYRKSLKL
ncbi:MAG: response regulator [Eubacteriales bacterium]|nr:response regulator [Eubacteriales bacterium]